MEVVPEERIERVLEWYEKDPGEALVGEEVLANLDLAALRAIFAPDEEDDPDMFLHYEVEPADVPRLQQAVEHRIDLGAYDYFVAAYEKDKQLSESNAVFGANTYEDLLQRLP